MSIRKVNFVEGEYYHIYNRGNSKRTIFHDKSDYLRFVFLLFISNDIEYFKISNLTDLDFKKIKKTEPLVSIGSYCLMPNHFHILITERVENGISKFMQKLSTAYSMYYNRKYNRTGSLFEGKFKSEHINNNRYMKYIFSYIHLNPLKLKNKDWKKDKNKDKNILLSYLDSYPYSSYLDFLKTGRDQEVILDLDKFPKYFPNKESLKKEVFEWLSFNE